MPRCGVSMPDAVRSGRVHLGGDRLAEGVADDDVDGALGARVVGDADDPLSGSSALERAGERRRDAQLDRAADLAARVRSRRASPRGCSRWCGRCWPGCGSPTRRSSTGNCVRRRRRPSRRAGVSPPTSSTVISSSGVSAATTSRVLAIGGTRSGRAIEPISSAGTPSASSSRTISTFRSVESILPVSCSPSRRVTSRSTAREVKLRHERPSSVRPMASICSRSCRAARRGPRGCARRGPDRHCGWAATRRRSPGRCRGSRRAAARLAGVDVEAAGSCCGPRTARRCRCRRRCRSGPTGTPASSRIFERLVAAVRDRSTRRSPRPVRRAAPTAPRWSAGPGRSPRSGRPMVSM